MTKITEYLEVYTKQYLLDLALSEVPDDIDKRQGAIIYDTLAIVSAKFADVFMEVKKLVEQSYILTATDDDCIDYRVWIKEFFHSRKHLYYGDDYMRKSARGILNRLHYFDE